VARISYELDAGLDTYESAAKEGLLFKQRAGEKAARWIAKALT
jgi:hypothetical protein